MAFCENCGKTVEPGIKFCENCGVPIDDPSTTQLANRQEPTQTHAFQVPSPAPQAPPTSSPIPPIYIAAGIAVVVIIIALVFASGVMSGSSDHVIPPTVTVLKGTVPGDVATVAYTIYDDQNRPIVTTNGKLYNDTLAKGGTVFYSNPLKVPVGITTTANVTRIPVQYQEYQTYFGLFRDEMNQIAKGLSGMKMNEEKRISMVIPKDPLETRISADQFALLVKPVAETRVNEQFALALTDHPQINLDNTAPVDQYLRTFYVKGISPEGFDMKYGYSTIDLQIINF